jgi:SAM-dependent methyltransferase
MSGNDRVTALLAFSDVHRGGQMANTPRLIEAHYEDFYSKRNPEKVYPVEFVVRTFLGTYPCLKIDRSTYRGAKILDLGFGDGRNMPLLHDLGFAISGIEISDDICQLTRERMRRLGVPVEIQTGSNSRIPFTDGFFDYLLACHACYYVLPEERFSDNLKEITRVLRPGGRFIYSLPKTDTYILKDATPMGGGHYRITQDPYGIRNGGVFRAFSSRDEIIEELGGVFTDFSLGLCENDFYGTYEKVWIGTCVRKP